MNTIPIFIPKDLTITQEQFKHIAGVNRELRLEKTAKGELIIMPPTGGETGKKNLEIEGQLWQWNRQTKIGVVFNSSTGFHLPNGADRSPDAAWIIKERWEQLTLQEREDFPPLCPDFVIELRSKTDSLKSLQDKMQEYLDNGLRLGLLIDPKNKQVEIYRPLEAVEVLNYPQILSGESVLPGFVLDLEMIW